MAAVIGFAFLLLFVGVAIGGGVGFYVGRAHGREETETKTNGASVK